VRPGTGDPVPAGEVGEVVVTTLFNADYPLVRFGTGDLSALLPGKSPCGRTNLRIKGWLGRADQTTKVKGMFVHPSQVAAIVRKHPEIAKARLVVDNADGNDRMTLNVEVPGGRAADAEAIVASIREVTKLRGEVAFRAPGELPNDGRVIDDVRKFD
jgi:phenylacetate-CoA ligase